MRASQGLGFSEAENGDVSGCSIDQKWDRPLLLLQCANAGVHGTEFQVTFFRLLAARSGT